MFQSLKVLQLLNIDNTNDENKLQNNKIIQLPLPNNKSNNKNNSRKSS